jgi:hypothetical protein
MAANWLAYYPQALQIRTDYRSRDMWVCKRDFCNDLFVIKTVLFQRFSKLLN